VARMKLIPSRDLQGAVALLETPSSGTQLRTPFSGSTISAPSRFISARLPRSSTPAVPELLRSKSEMDLARIAIRELEGTRCAMWCHARRDAEYNAMVRDRRGWPDDAPYQRSTTSSSHRLPKKVCTFCWTRQPLTSSGPRDFGSSPISWPQEIAPTKSTLSPDPGNQSAFWRDSRGRYLSCRPRFPACLKGNAKRISLQAVGSPSLRGLRAEFIVA